jgi:hypothetical protein
VTGSYVTADSDLTGPVRANAWQDADGGPLASVWIGGATLVFADPARRSGACPGRSGARSLSWEWTSACGPGKSTACTGTGWTGFAAGSRSST